MDFAEAVDVSLEDEMQIEREMQAQDAQQQGGAGPSGPSPVDGAAAEEEDEEEEDGVLNAPRRSGRNGGSGAPRRIAVDDDDEVAEDELFGEQEGGGGESNHHQHHGAAASSSAGGGGGGGWGGVAGAVHAHNQGMDNQQAHQAGHQQDGDAASDAGMSDGNSAGDAPVYPEYDESILRVDGVSQPLLMPRDELWKCVEAIGPNEMRPKRAMRVLVPTDFFRRDAEFFRQWQLPKGAESRCRATSAIVSLLFAGMQMGIPSGKHEEKMRQQVQADEQEGVAGGGGRNAGKSKPQPITKVSRYTYAPHDDETDSYPMFQIGIEDIYNDDMSEIIALGVWLFIYDENHSTSHLVRKVVQNTHGLKTSKQVSGASAASRSKDASAEADRHGKAGFGFEQVRNNFESTVGLQYLQISTMDDWQQMLDLHSGRTSGSRGRPCVDDLAKHINCAAGRRQLEGDSKTGCGGKHPIAPEFVLNAKRRQGLSFGAVNLDGSLMDVCEDQLNPATYWRTTPQGSGFFCVPNIGKPCFWMCTSVEKRTIFDLPLTRPLQGTVTPGPNLMECFLEMETRKKNADAGQPDRVIHRAQLVADQNAMNRLRSLATARDEHQRKQDQLLRNSLISYDLMTPAANASLNAGDVAFNPDASGDEANYTLKVVSMTKRVGRETDRIYTKVISPWVSRMEKELTEMCRELQEQEIPDDDAQWDAYWAKRSNFYERFYLVKKDLTQYHLRLNRTCFLSSKDAATLPSGYKAMFQGLEDGLSSHGGSASIAFNGGKTGKGRQLMSKDRQVWGSLQEWLRNIFVDCCKIDGRDRRLMDEMFLHCFEMYANTTFVLVIASEKGKGKSVRAMRLAEILPEGWCSFNSATTQRSGMNGNNSPSNGTTVVCDEMISDLTPSEPTERMEFWKTIVGKREFEIERTRCVKNSDGSESHMTFKIVTDHKETYLICCNMGQCFTAGSEEPTDGKCAMIQRTVCLQARAEADSDSPDDDFKSNLKKPEVASAIDDFRLFTSLCGFVRMSMMGIDWLQPDFAMANLIFKEGDRMLIEEYGMPKPEPRRLVKRKENLTTMCVHEAVARVFFFKQTAVAYEAGRPDRHGRGKKFEIGDLWDVLRTLRPTREMVLAAWSHSLEYSIGTSSHGINVMTAVCEKLGFLIDYIFKRLPTRKAEELGGALGPDTFELDSFMTEVPHPNPAGGQQLANQNDTIGAKRSTLEAYSERMARHRILRNDFRRQAVDKVQDKQPFQAIQAVVGPDAARKYADALFPTAVSASMYYKPQVLLQWATGKRVAKDEARTCRGGTLKFKERERDGGSKEFDFGWLVLYNTGSADRTPTWSGVTKESLKEASTVGLFDMHVQGVADALFMLASSENSRLLAENPKLPWMCRGANAFVDQNGNKPNRDSLTIGLTPITMAGQANPVEAHEGDALEQCRVRTGVNHHCKTPLHKELDLMHNRCRLPSLQPHTSTKVIKGAPIRRSEGAIEVNSVACYEHVAMLMEGILRCSKTPGLKGLQERFQSNGTVPSCLTAHNCTALQGQALLDTVRCLPYSIDMMQMGWTLDLASRLYTPPRNEVRQAFNTMLQADGLGELIPLDSLPELSLRYPGFPKDNKAEKTEALRLISIKTSNTRPLGQKQVDIASASPLQDLDPELLRYETEIAIGGKADDADIEEHRRSLIGSGYAWGVKGDVFDYNTWADHVTASLLGRGNTDGLLDSRGAYTDKAHTAVLDAEFMFEARLVERRCIAGWEEYKNLGLTAPVGTTYSYLEAHPIDQPAPGQKRKQLAEPPRVRKSASTRLANGYSVTPRPAVAGPSGGRPAMALRDGDSRSD